MHTASVAEHGHAHPGGYIAASNQWGMDGESSSPVIATSSHAREMDGEYTVVNG